MDNVMNHNEIAKDKRTRHTIGPQVIHRDVHNIPLTEFMKALGQEHPVAADGDLRIYNSPYDLSSKGTMVINVHTNLWRDTKSGANGGIYDLAYELTGCANKSELNRYIAGEMDFFKRQQIKNNVDMTTINNKNMAKKKTEEPATEKKQEQPKKKTAQKTSKSKTVSKEETSKEESKKASASKKEDAKVENPVDTKVENAPTQKSEAAKREPREPLFVTCNGDRISHAHYWFKKDDPTAYLSVQFNGHWLPSKSLKPEEAAELDQLRGNKQEQNAMFKQLFEQYYPIKVAPKLPDAEFKFPQTFDTPNGEVTINKYNFYQHKDEETQKYFGPTYVYAEIYNSKMDKTMKMSTIADDLSVENYHSHTRSPKDQIILSFGRQLGVDNAKEHYQQFNLPKSVEFDNPQKQITLSKIKDTNGYNLIVDCPNGQKLETKLPYLDANAFFAKNASKQQLAAKFFSTDLAAMDWSKKPEQKQEVQKSMAMK